MLKTITVMDKRFPGGSKEEIYDDYGVVVTELGNGSFDVSGDEIDVDAYVEDYGIVPPINFDNDEEEDWVIMPI